MLVDDEPDITAVMKMGLERKGFAVDTFNDPKEALANYKPGSYDAIVFDIRMPSMSGFDLARLIWRKDTAAKICFLSAFEVHEDEAKEILKINRHIFFLKKPLNSKALVEHIEQSKLRNAAQSP